MNINLHIERLVLDGVNILPSDRFLVHNNVATELTRMVAQGGLTARLASAVTLSKITAGQIQLNEGSNPIQLGQQVAQSVYGGIGRG